MTALISFSDRFQKNVRACSFWASALLFLFKIPVLPAQSNVSFETSITTKEVLVGVPFELTFTLKNAEGSRFTPPGFPGFNKGAISETRGMSFVNGRSSSSQTWILELTSNKPGVFTTGSATVVAGGKTLSSKAITINVLSSGTSGKGNVPIPPGSDDRVFVASDFDQKEAFVGQQVTWRIRLYTQLSVDGYDIIALPEFDGFFSKEKIRYDKRVEYLTLGKKKYAVRTLHEQALFPQEAGELSVGVARVSVGIEQPGAQGFLFGPKPVNLQTQPVGLTVKALPQPLPTEFTGGVGLYEWDVKADTTALTTDDALTIVVEVKGNGDARRFAAPKISVPPNCEIFEPRILEEEEYEGELEILHRKRFEYVVLPKDTGIQEIKPVLSYFNADSNRYCQLRTASIQFKVTAGKNYALSNKLPEQTNTQKPGLLERLSKWLRSPILWSIVVLPFLAIGIFVLLKKRKPSSVAYQEPGHQAVTNKPADSTPISSPNKPLGTTLLSAQLSFANVGLLLKTDEPRQFYDALFKALHGWLSATFGIQPAQMNEADVRTILHQRGASPIRVQALLSVWHTCEQAIYGGQAQLEQMESTWQMAGQVLEALDREIH
jgi:BatD DUF11 like domain